MLDLTEEYKKLLDRDLGFSGPDKKKWGSTIEKVMNTLGIESLDCINIRHADPMPGKNILNLLMTWWLDNKGKYWRNLYSLDPYTAYTPYGDLNTFRIHIKNIDELVSTLSGSDIYKDLDYIKNIFKTEDYNKLCSLHGIEVIVKE